MEDYQQYCYPGTHCSEQMFKTDECVSLRVIHFKPIALSPYPPVVMVVGLATVIESFQDIIGELTRDFEVYYVETREKSSSRLSGKVKYDMKTVARDITSIINLLQLPVDQYILFGYSYSAAIIVEAYPYLKPKPICLLLLSPTPSFYYPRWSLAIIQVAVPFYGVLKPIAKWYLGNFVINRKEDNDMYLFTSRALDRADPRKLKNAILGVAGHTVWESLKSIDCSTLIVDTSSDGIHLHHDIMRMTNSIKRSTYIDMQNSKRTHGAELTIEIKDYLNNLKNSYATRSD
jgi:pimeloyl-ACP methyl ester carboxylesterase